MATDTISILDGSTFVVSDRRGDIDADPSQPHGLFHRDTRYLSRWRVTVNGLLPDPLSVENEQYFSAQFFLVPPTDTIYRNAYLSLIRKRLVGNGFHEDVAVLNHANEPATVELRIEAGADFADLFEVKDALEKKGRQYQEVRDGALALGYRRDDFVRETRISTSVPAAEITSEGLSHHLQHADAHSHDHDDDARRGSAHGHSHGLVDRSILRSRAGVRGILISLAVLGAAAAAQALVFVVSGSVALLRT